MTDIRQLQWPAVLKGQTDRWPASQWTPYSLADELTNMKLQFRVGPKQPHNGVIWEGNCEHVEATVSDFVQWTDDSATERNPLKRYNSDSHWVYADYKYMATQFKDKPALISAVKWSVFGLEGRDGMQSTFWLGSAGAHTPCHQDSYGCNLVAQIYGRKRWVLFPPSDTNSLYPTRIPYEESSVFSQVNVQHPDLSKYPKFKNATPYTVTLVPGDVLYVPHQWWHFVESLETSISVNTWIELPCDHEVRVQEAMTRTVMCSILSSAQDDKTWLNPTEEITSPEENLNYIKTSVQLYTEHVLTAERSQDLDVQSKCEHKAQAKTVVDTTGTDECSSPKKLKLGQFLHDSDEIQKESGEDVSHQEVLVKLSGNKAGSDLTVTLSVKNGKALDSVIKPVPSCKCEHLYGQLPESFGSQEKKGSGVEQRTVSNSSDDDPDVEKSTVQSSNINLKHVAESFTHPSVIDCVTKILLGKINANR